MQKIFVCVFIFLVCTWSQTSGA